MLSAAPRHLTSSTRARARRRRARSDARSTRRRSNKARCSTRRPTSLSTTDDGKAQSYETPRGDRPRMHSSCAIHAVWRIGRRTRRSSIPPPCWLCVGRFSLSTFTFPIEKAELFSLTLTDLNASVAPPSTPPPVCELRKDVSKKRQKYRWQKISPPVWRMADTYLCIQVQLLRSNSTVPYIGYEHQLII